MIILLRVDYDAVYEIDPDTLPKKIVSTKDAYSIPSGMIRLIKTYAGSYRWDQVDHAAVQAAIANGIKAMDVRRI